jgi:hypothetical protein
MADSTLLAEGKLPPIALRTLRQHLDEYIEKLVACAPPLSYTNRLFTFQLTLDITLHYTLMHHNSRTQRIDKYVHAKDPMSPALGLGHFLRRCCGAFLDALELEKEGRDKGQSGQGDSSYKDLLQGTIVGH